MAVIFGPAISVLFAGDLSQFPDTQTYTGLFHFDFDQSPVRRYRVIIPFIARGLYTIFHLPFSKLAPTYYTGDFAMMFSFFLVNITLTCLSGVLVYRYCREYGASALAAIIGLMVFLTNRNAIYFASIPLVDSLYFLVLVMMVLGIKTKNNTMLTAAIFIGPFAKEAFVFVAPVIFFFSHMPKKKSALLFIISGLLVFSYRYAFDKMFHFPVESGMNADMNHLRFIKYPLGILFSFYGLYKILMNIGVWLLLPIAAVWLHRPYIKKQLQQVEGYVWVYLLTVFVQMMLSISVERMFYLAMPVMAVMMAWCADGVIKRVSNHNENHLVS